MRYWISGTIAALAFVIPVWQTAHATTQDLVHRVAPTAWPELPQRAQDLAQRIVQLQDHGKLPFAIVDKQAALISVYHADGTLSGVSTVLLGLTAGDESSPSVGERTQTGQLRISDRTTPAGRFDSIPGRNLTGEAVVWIDYGSALAIHRLRPAPISEMRPQRMASGNPLDKRISAGCVVAPEAFFDAVIKPVLGTGRAAVYVMPEHKSWQEMWTTLKQPAL